MRSAPCFALCLLGGLIACDGPSTQPQPTADTAAAEPAAVTSASADEQAAAAEPSAQADTESSGATADASAKPDGEQAARAAKPTEKAAADEPAKEVVGKKAVENSFAAWLQSSGRHKAGQPSSVQAVLTSKGEFKCNQEYPHKFKYGAPPSGVSYPDKYARGVSRGKKRTVVTVPFTPASAGNKTISGTFYFSVCNDESCQIKKQPMSLTVTVE